MNRAKKVTHPILTVGETVPESGVYEVIHGNCLSQQYEMIFVAGQTLTACQLCGSQVRYQLRRAIAHISEDGDFKTGKSRG